MSGVTREEIERTIAKSFFRTELGGRITLFGEGVCELSFTPQDRHRQHLGAVHGGIIGALADDACAWACCSVAGPLVTATYVVNFLNAATGVEIVAQGRLLKAGRRVAVGQAEVWSIDASGTKTLAAALQATNALI